MTSVSIGPEHPYKSPDMAVCAWKPRAGESRLGILGLTGCLVTLNC